jgi:polyisoprenoid-binding protein YceI
MTSEAGGAAGPGSGIKELARHGALAGQWELDPQASHVEFRVSFTADITEARPDTITLRAELTVDRSRFGMTWSPMRISSMQATGSITARFTRAARG